MKKKLKDTLEFLDEFIDKANAKTLNYGDRLRLVRTTLGHTQEYFGGKVGRSATAINLYERCKRNIPATILQKCCDRFGINPAYITHGTLPIFSKMPSPFNSKKIAFVSIREASKVSNIEVLDEQTTAKALVKADKVPPNEGKVLFKKPKREKKENPAVKEIQGLTYKQLNDKLKQDIAELKPAVEPASYNYFVHNGVELDIIVFESKIYYSFADIAKIVGNHLLNDLLACTRTFTQEQLKNVAFRTFQQVDKYYKDEVYVEYKGFVRCYHGYKNADIAEFVKYTKSIEPHLSKHFTELQNTELDGEFGVILFENTNLGKVRVKGNGEEPLFCLADICKILEIQNPTDLKNAVKTEFELPRLNLASFDSGYGIKEFTMLTEPQLYFVLMRSDKPKARPFRQWIVNEVLPSIRKKGRYEHRQAQPQIESEVPDNLALATMNLHQTLIRENKNLSFEIERYRSMFKREGEFSLSEAANILETSPFILKNFLIKENLITNYPNLNKQYPTQFAKDRRLIKMKLVDTKKLSYDIFITTALMDKLKEYFATIS